MTRTVDADLMATLSRPSESGAPAGAAIAGGGAVSNDFFQLKRPPTVQNELRTSLGGE
jgi:hypothetical protein